MGFGLLFGDKVDFTRFAFLYHFKKVLTVQNGSTGNTLIGKNTGELPFIVLLDHFRVVLHLKLIAACLGVLIRADTAVCAYTKFLLFGFRSHILFCWDDLYLLLRTVCVCITDGVLRGLPFSSLRPRGRSGCFFVIFIDSPPPAADYVGG